jgi:hypothetical protein
MIHPSIARRKIAEALFKVLGLCSLAIAVGTLALLFGALVFQVSRESTGSSSCHIRLVMPHKRVSFRRGSVRP